MGDVAGVLAMDRTTLTAALKPLQRRGLIEILVDAKDRRSRRLVLTAAGRSVLEAALPIWVSSHAAVEAKIADSGADRLRADLRALS